ncbi:hypothetical protein F511_24538 [Dorcoceras hygrometricum]|uniref:Uncharacterized protein n=1 Tax=Dorcoceras hygrometricum TaxID=472368 RepID=A0A2Z7BZS4_9LAMI|nr:hypothetical protein F511_24538 [Dorcoceras hygrometricum]
MINSSYICSAVGSQYKQSAVGLVFMEWAAGLAMETSKVESAISPGTTNLKPSLTGHDNSADLIEIFDLKGPYYTLTMTDWFLQALSVIPRRSWGDVARLFTMIRWVSPKMWFRSHKCCEPTASCIPEPLRVTQVPVSQFPYGN